MDIRETGYAGASAASTTESGREQASPPILESAGDSLLGIGQIASGAKEAFLPQVIASTSSRLVASSGRLLGGIGTLLTSGYRIMKTYQNDANSGKGDFSATRKEVFVTSASVTSGFAAGTVFGLATAGVTAVGAPAIVVGGIAAAGVVAVGYAAYKVRNFAGELFDSFSK